MFNFMPILLLLVPHSCLGLYIDQAGTFDWYKAYVGHVRSASFHGVKPRVFVGTEQGVVGALNLRDGSIQWRSMLGHAPQQGLLATLLEPKRAFLTLSHGMLRAWDHQRGGMLWEEPLQMSNTDGSAAAAGGSTPTYQPSMMLLAGSPSAVAVMAGNQIRVFAVADGMEKSSANLDVSSIPAGALTKLHEGPTPGSLICFAWVPGGSEVVRFSAAEGVEGSSVTFSAPQPLSGESAIGAQGLAVLTADAKSVCVSGLGSSEAQSLDCHALADIAPEVAASTPAELHLTANSRGVALAANSEGSHWVLLLKVSAKQGVQKLAFFEGASAASAGQEGPSGTEYLAVASVSGLKKDSVTVQYVNTRSGTVVGKDVAVPRGATDRLAPGSANPGLRSVTVGTFQMKDNSDGFRALLVWGDERISLVQQGVTVWVRDEYLAGVQSSLFTELPASKDTAVDAPPPGSPEARQDFAQFVQMQILSAKVQFQLAKPEEMKEYSDLRGALSKRTSPTRDSRGFRKLIVVATEAGKVAALHNGDGHIVWSRPFPRELAPQQLLQWQLFHDLTHAPRVAALHSGDSGSILSVLDAHTGAALEEVKLPGRVDKLVGIGTLSVAEGVEQSVYLAVELPETTGATPWVTLLPDTPVARDFFVAQHRSLFFWTESAAAHTAPSTPAAPALQGYGFDGTAAEAALSGAPIHAVRTWSLAFPQPLLAVAVRDPKEPTHSSVKVLGDRSIKYRYLNLNTMVVVTGLAPGVWVDPDEQDSIQATIHIVDSVSGHVLHHQLQPYARGPAAAVITDNMAAVQLWDASAARFALTSLELFDATPREFSVLDALFNPNATQPVTSFNPPPLEVISASFFTRTPARSFGVTRTRAGITSKQLLARTMYDQVYAIDPRYIDPRRPKKTKLTAQEMEERLLPYQDTLPVNSLSFVTYDKQVMGLRGTTAAASRLESTSLIFNWGVDLQYTRVSPARGFDTLDDDFNYGLLLTALLVLSTASVVAHFYTKSTSLAAKWK